MPGNFVFTQDNPENLNCAGEPDVLEPHMRDTIKENDILIWIYNMIDEAARVDFEFFLKDGCILCKLMNRIKPGCIPEETITWEGARSKQKNIKNFLEQAEAYGVPKEKLFHPEDLLHLRNVPRVTRCIYALAKLVAQDPNMGDDCPKLGDEPSFLKEPKKKIDMPGHRDTKDVLAQLTSEKPKEEKKTTKHSLYN
ncbi:myophilin-like [Penaeus japonicus]|uniref:myophilin-like n=1 Tax=Penaeus japonicus TaxID=27405 RepID=UPI001C70DC0A|nr:myophilin-like [Penaeus japonicus]